MKKQKFSLLYKDAALARLVKRSGHKTLGLWATDCARRVLPYFEKKYPKDLRPRVALETLREWIKTGVFGMAVIRKASLDSHAAAREVGDDDPARSAARSAGQAVATAHVSAHSLAAANYALQARYRAAEPPKADAAVTKERDWQYKRLLKLQGKSAVTKKKSSKIKPGKAVNPNNIFHPE